uniref:Protein kinase domain-containing protein n=2 Tax=Oryza TaxID=4527 RepID=A0A0D3FW63_9ORYZ
MALSPTSNSSSSSSSQSKGKRRPSNLAIALISAGAGSALVALLAALAAVYYLRRHRGSSSPVSGRIHAEPTGTAPRVERRLSALLSKGPNTTVEQFPLVALRAATDCFSPAKRIGSGSFGAVYRASLPDGREVAIKRAERRDTGGPSSSSAAAARRVDHEAAFVSELALLSRVNHKNLVRLLGFCADGGERILVYEFMPNGTLHDHLHRRAASAAAPLSPPLASWPSRLRLALGAARGIEYMHTYAVPPIIHRDIKSSNILLDSCWTAKVSDFGLSLLNTLDGDNAAAGDGGNAGDGDDEERCVTAGTVGYMDPEYYRLQHLTDKSDVYSFGVVLLELLSGCKAIQKYEGSGSPKNVVDMAVPHIEGDRVHRVLDARLPLPTPWEMEAVAYVGYLAADCVRLAGRDRPTMSEVVGVLERAVASCDEYEEGGAGAGGEPALSRSCTDGSTAT